MRKYWYKLLVRFRYEREIWRTARKTGATRKHVRWMWKHMREEYQAQLDRELLIGDGTAQPQGIEVSDD